jgi:hypothetical protein
MKNSVALIITSIFISSFLITNAYPDIVWTRSFNYNGKIIEETPKYVIIQSGNKQKKILKKDIEDITYASVPDSKQPKLISEYKILEDEVSDIPLKCQVSLKILVSENISETRLRKILTDIHYTTSTRSGFKYHNQPTHIDILAFTDKEFIETDQWVGMLNQIGKEQKPKIDIQIPKIQSKPSDDIQNALGKWIEYGYLGGSISIFKEGDNLVLKREFSDESILKEEVTRRKTRNGIRFDLKEESPSGDYYLINHKGDLEIRDELGLIRTAKKLK